MHRGVYEEIGNIFIIKRMSVSGDKPWSFFATGFEELLYNQGLYPMEAHPDSFVKPENLRLIIPEEML